MDAHQPGNSQLLEADVRRLVVERPLFLGDLFMTEPALRALRRRFPHAEITLIGLPWALEFVRRVPTLLDRFLEFPGCEGIPEVEYCPQRTERFLAEQREYGYDLAVQMHGNGSYINGFVAGLGAKVTLGFAPEGDDRLTISTLQVVPGQEMNEVCNWLRLVGLVGAHTEDLSLEFHPLPEDEREAEVLLAELPRGYGPLIGIHPGAKEAIRQWPPEKFAQLANCLAERFDARILITGNAMERDIAEAVRDRTTCPVLDLSGRTGIGSLAALISRLDLLVTNDTGPSHMASATRTPSVAMFGPTRPWQFAPLDRDRHTVVDSLQYAPADIDPVEALKTLSVDVVFDAACRTIERYTAAERAPTSTGAE